MIGIGDRTRAGAGRFFYVFRFAVVDGEFSALAVRKRGADFCGEQQHLVWHRLAFGADEHVTGAEFLRVQPDIVRLRALYQPVVLQIVSARLDAEAVFFEQAEGDLLLFLAVGRRLSEKLCSKTFLLDRF